MLTLLKLGLLGSYIIIISHCLCSSGLFYLVVMFFIVKLCSRLVLGLIGLLLLFEKDRLRLI